MRVIFLAAIFLTGFIAAAAAGPDKRVALVIGQNGYSNFSPLSNPSTDARSVAALLSANGFDIISCDGKEPGCFDLDRAGLLAALAKLKERAADASLALVYYAGHGAATEEGANMLAPVDASWNCETGAIAQGVPVESLMQAAGSARYKFLILDACRNNPLRDVCPGLKGKKLSFTRIEAGAMQGLLLITSTQSGQQALDGFPGGDSPFVAALLAALAKNPNIYFEQVMDKAVWATYHEVRNIEPGYLQIPGKIVGGVAPLDCLAGHECIGDPNLGALAKQNGKLAAEAAGVSALLADEERARGTPYTFEERTVRVGQLEVMLASIGRSADPLRREGGRLLKEGDLPGGQAKLDEALDADEKVIAGAGPMAAERQLLETARAARDLAWLVGGRDTLKAVAYYRRAARLDPADPVTWSDLAGAAERAGLVDEAKAAYEQAVRAAQAGNDLRNEIWSLLSLGDLALAQGDPARALNHYTSALKIAEPAVRADPIVAQWRRDLAAVYSGMGDALAAQGDLAGVLKSFKDSLSITDGLVKAHPNKQGFQSELADTHEKAGDALVKLGDLAEALKNFQDSLQIRDRLAKADPNYVEWQRDLTVSYTKLADVYQRQGKWALAKDALGKGHEIMQRLTTQSPDNVEWKKGLARFEAQAAALPGSRMPSLVRQAHHEVKPLKPSGLRVVSE